ncbi:MAG: thiolase family protein [Hyphomicrobiaceae bacterium]|nr:thiolase family protein [Hyphomicrobiaceae bacterium]
MSKVEIGAAYIVAARRTAIGRVGGLHRNRRVEELAVPVVQSVLADAGIAPDQIDEIIIGNATQGGNPARLIALAAGLPERASAQTIDRQCASGLEAILAAARLVTLGDADAIVAGGAESLSNAPWRVAKPRSIYQLPRFVPVETVTAETAEEPQLFEASEDLARQLGITRQQQDDYALRSRRRAASAREARSFIGEIVPLRANVEEARDQSSIDPTLEEMAHAPAFVEPGGTLTQANTSAMHDGAAMVLVVSERRHAELGRPPALKLVSSAVAGVSPTVEAFAPIEATRKLYTKLNGFRRDQIRAFELSETSAAQAIALRDALQLDESILNAEGGAIARGHPFAASGAVLVVRLFSRLVRRGNEEARFGVATQGAIGGLGVAALFEAV